MKRSLIVKIHLVLASVFLPFMLLMPLGGMLHLLDMDGTVVKTEAFRSTGVVPEAVAEQETFFREEFKKAGLKDFDFEYIRASGANFTFRPSSRVHYSASKTSEGLVFYKLEPDFRARIFEIHKGHGPRKMRWLEAAFGFALILAALTGIYLGLSVPMYRRITIVSTALGIALCAAFML